ncbi:unnamed protein product [Prunus armeniaca]
MDDLSKPYRRWFQLDMFGPDCRCPKGPHFGFPNSLGWSMHAPKDNPLSELEAENDCPTAAAMPRSDINYSHYMEGNQNLQGIKQSRAMYNVQFDPSEDKGLFLLWKVELDLHIHDHSHPIVLTLRWAIRVINFIGEILMSYYIARRKKAVLFDPFDKSLPSKRWWPIVG